MKKKFWEGKNPKLEKKKKSRAGKNLCEKNFLAGKKVLGREKMYVEESCQGKTLC